MFLVLRKSAYLRFGTRVSVQTACASRPCHHSHTFPARFCGSHIVPRQKPRCRPWVLANHDTGAPGLSTEILLYTLSMTDGQITALAREKEGRADIVFEPALHSKIVKNCLLLDMTVEQIADVIGVSLGLLSQWIEVYPELRAAKIDAKAADAQVVGQLYELALGYKDEKNKYHPPHVIALIFWCKARLGWSDKPLPPKAPERPGDMSLENLGAIALTLLQKLERGEGHMRAIDVTPKDEE